MNIQAITVTNLIGTALVIILVFNGRLTFRSQGTANTFLYIMCLLVGTSCLGEMFSYLIDGKFFPGDLALATFLNSWLYLCNTLFSTVWVYYVDWKLYEDMDRLRNRYRPLVYITVIMFVIVLGNVFGHYLFYFDASHIYHRKDLAYILFVYPIAAIMYTIILVARFRKERHGLEFFPIWSFTIPFFTGVIAQALFYGISLAWCSTAIGLVSLHLSLQNELIATDSLTNCYNRTYLSFTLNSISWNSSENRSGIMLDMDHFKEINDTWGHSTGDQALIDAARLIEKAIPDDSLLFRYAGDEFVILLMTSDEEEIRSVMKRIRDELKDFNETKQRPYQLGLSMGYSVYDRNATGQDAFFEKMDAFMYKNKTGKRTENA